MTTVNFPAIEVISTAAAPTLPAWRVGLAVNAWTEISGSSMLLCPPTVNPNPARSPFNRIRAWNGLSLDTRNSEVWSPANGGHDDYWGNEVLSIRLSDNAPAWVERRASTPNSQINGGAGSSTTTHYDDGRPCSSHTYFSQQFITARNRAIRFGVGARSTSGFPALDVDAFNISTNDWDVAGTFPPILSVGQSAWAVCKNFTNEDIYVWAGFSLSRWNQSTNTWTPLPDAPRSGYEAASAVDTIRGRVFMLGGEAANIPCYFNISNNTYTTLTLGGSQGAVLDSARVGMVYMPEIDKFLVRMAAADGKVYSIDPVTFACELLPTTGGSLVPSNDGNAPYTKFLRCPQYNGVVYYPRYEGNIWFIRTH